MNYIITLLFLVFAISAHSQTDTIYVYFDFDKDRLSEKEQGAFAVLNARDIEVISVTTHCDTAGSAQYNIDLSQRRLAAVLELISHKEVKFTEALGESRAAASASYDAKEFRRADIVFTLNRPVLPPMEEEEVEEEVVEVVSEEVRKITNSFDEFIEGDSEESVIQTSILFYNRSVQYLPVSQPELDALCAFMIENPKVKANIRGHICCNPYMEWDDISEGRARTVYQYLLQCGIERKRLTYRGFGTSIPFRSPEVTEEDRRLNRRVDIIFMKE